MAKRDVLTITESALGRIRALLESRGKPSFGIRISVKTKGCSGLAYSIEFANESKVGEELIEKEDVKVLIDPGAIMFLIGSEMDYVEEKLSSGFTFKNPNEKGRCGCGESFRV
jgi:iron-sulfur cluster assembly protein